MKLSQTTENTAPSFDDLHKFSPRWLSYKLRVFSDYIRERSWLRGLFLLAGTISLVQCFFFFYLITRNDNYRSDYFESSINAPIEFSIYYPNLIRSVGDEYPIVLNVSKQDATFFSTVPLIVDFSVTTNSNPVIVQEKYDGDNRIEFDLSGQVIVPETAELVLHQMNNDLPNTISVVFVISHGQEVDRNSSIDIQVRRWERALRYQSGVYVPILTSSILYILGFLPQIVKLFDIIRH